MPETSASVLAVDVGGTKTDVGLFASENSGSPRLVRATRYASADHADLESVLTEFLGGEPVAAVGVAAAGPVDGDEIRTTNLPWLISSARIAARTGASNVVLLNDLGAAARGVLELDDGGLRRLKPGEEREDHRVVVAPGTGLGEALLVHEADGYRVLPSEGGHVGFAPRDDEQIELLRFLAQRENPVSFEHVLSGPGLVRLFDFVTEVLGEPVATQVNAAGRTAQAIGEAAVAGECAASRRCVRLFAAILAAHCGDLVLASLARGGVYVGGGVALKLLPAIQGEEFAAAFVGAGPFAEMLSKVPVDVVLEPRVALIGAAFVASERLQ